MLAYQDLLRNGDMKHLEFFTLSWFDCQIIIW